MCDQESQLIQIRRLAAQEISNYAVVLVRASRVVGESQLLGNGTLVQIGSARGILTAQHVAREIRTGMVIGMAILATEHHLSVPGESFERVDIAEPVREGTGPDLSFLRLPESAARTISASSSFFNLPNGEGRFRSLRFENDRGIWAVVGVAKEEVVREGPTHHFEEVLGFPGAVGFTFVRSRFEEGGYDFLDLSVRYGEETNAPRDFRGYSGGGVWFVPILSRQGNLVAESALLSGVTFSQSATKEEMRLILCHGPKSIYECALTFLTERFGATRGE